MAHTNVATDLKCKGAIDVNLKNAIGTHEFTLEFLCMVEHAVNQNLVSNLVVMGSTLGVGLEQTLIDLVLAQITKGKNIGLERDVQIHITSKDQSTGRNVIQ